MSKKKTVEWEFEDNSYGKMIIQAKDNGSLSINVVGFMVTKNFNDWDGYTEWQKNNIIEVLNDV